MPTLISAQGKNHSHAKSFLTITAVFLLFFSSSLSILLMTMSGKAYAYAGTRSKAYALAYCIREALNDEGTSPQSLTSFYGAVQSSGLGFLRNDMDVSGFNTGDVFDEADVNKTDVGTGVENFDDTMRCTELAKDDSIGGLFGMQSLRDEAWETNSQGSPSARPIGYKNGGDTYDLSSYKFFKGLQDYLQSDAGKVKEREGFERLKQWFEHCTVRGSEIDYDYRIKINEGEKNEDTLYFKRNRSGIDVPIIGDDLVRYLDSQDIPVDQNGFGKAECVGKTLVPVAEKLGLYDDKKEAEIGNMDVPGGEGAGNGEESSDSSGKSKADKSCESEQGVMSWVMCPVINLIDGALNWADTQIQALLEVDSNYYTNEDIKKAYRTIRNLAYIILVPIVLVMVIGTAMGFDFVSAYTVKRALPRLLIAVIFMALSYNICVFIISFVNELGSAVLGIMLAPFSNEVATYSLNNMFGGNVLSGIISGALGAFGLVLLLWLFGGTLLLAAIMAFLVLMLRQMFIVVLMLAAPLAILAWIFPGNDKLWKLWWGSFSKLLLMYPLIMALIAMGRIFAYTIKHSGGAGLEGAILNPIMALVAYTIPYAFIPFTFKFAGGMFATMSGMVNDRSKGLFDRQRNRRQRIYKDTAERAKNENLFRGGNERNIRGRINRGVQTAALIGAGGAGINPFSMRRKLQGADTAGTKAEQQELIKNNQAVQDAMVDDDIARAVMRGRGQADIRRRLVETGRFAEGSQELEQAVGTVLSAQQAGSTKAVKSAMAVGLAASKTGYETHDEMYAAIIEAAEGDAALERSLLAETKKASEGVRPDLAAPGYPSQYNALQEVKGAMGTDREGTVRASVNTRLNREALQQTGAHAMLAGKTSQTIQKEMVQLGSDFDAAMASGDVEAATELASQITAYRNAMGSASPEARRHVMAMLDHVGYDESYVDERGLPRSASEQLGEIINFHMSSRNINTPTSEALSQTIHTRSGGYDSPGGSRIPEEARGNWPPRAGMPGDGPL